MSFGSATADYLIRSLARAGGDVSEMRVDGEALLEEAAYGAMLGGIIDVGAGTIKPVLRGLRGGLRVVGGAVRPAVEQATDTVAGIARQTRTVATDVAERTVAGGRRVVTTVVEDVRQGLHTSSIGPSGGLRRGLGGQRGSAVPVQAPEGAAVAIGTTERVPLWRAVGEAELADILAHGRFRIPEAGTTYETGKLFAETAQGAGAEAASMGSEIARGERFTIFRTDITGDRFGELHVFPDATKYGPVPSCLVPRDVLPELSPPQIQDVIIFRKP